MLAFLVLAAVMLIGAVGVVTLRQPVHAALALVGTLLTLAIAYVQLHAHFLAAIQVIVYAGAIMVLFLFVIMLLAIGGETSPTRLGWLRPAAWATGALAAGGIVATVSTSGVPLPSAEQMASVFTGSGIEGIADQLFGPYLLAFHLVGVLLLTGVVAAVGLVHGKSADAASKASPARSPGRVPVAAGRGR